MIKIKNDFELPKTSSFRIKIIIFLLLCASFPFVCMYFDRFYQDALNFLIGEQNYSLGLIQLGTRPNSSDELGTIILGGIWGVISLLIVFILPEIIKKIFRFGK